MSGLKTECDPGLESPRCAGNRSRVNLEVEDLRRARLAASSCPESWLGLSGSSAFSVLDRHRDLDASAQVSELFFHIDTYGAKAMIDRKIMWCSCKNRLTIIKA